MGVSKKGLDIAFHCCSTYSWGREGINILMWCKQEKTNVISPLPFPPFHSIPTRNKQSTVDYSIFAKRLLYFFVAVASLHLSLSKSINIRERERSIESIMYSCGKRPLLCRVSPHSLVLIPPNDDDYNDGFVSSSSSLLGLCVCVWTKWNAPQMNECFEFHSFCFIACLHLEWMNEWIN